MLCRKTIENDEDYLRQISDEVDFLNDNYLEHIAKLKEYCDNNQVYALSPIQIGIPKRIIYIKNTTTDMDNNKKGYNENIIYINPIIVKEEGKTIFLEGCESCVRKEDGASIYYVGEVERPYKIEIEYYDINGNKKKKSIEGFEATIFCHEYDHLNGILHMDKIKEILEMTPEEM